MSQVFSSPPATATRGLLQREPLKRVFAAQPATFAAGAVRNVLVRLDRALDAFGSAWPAPSSVAGVYPAITNVEWTNGFWTGLLWLAHELTGDEKYRKAALAQVDDFHRRIRDRINTDHHDLGFLYSLSCVAGYKLTGSDSARQAALMAAEALMTRYLPKAGIIQAWGDLNDPAEAGRMIIDCNLNLPLLFWASQETGEVRFADAARAHLRNALTHIVRPDGSTFHTFHMDPISGAPLNGSTHQGAADASCWARGQAWGIAGFPLNYRYFNEPALISTSAALANYFLNRLPDDLVCCWDLIFTSNDGQRDSSAAAIAACGLLELVKWLPDADPDKSAYRSAAVGIMHNLADGYAFAADDPGNGQLAHGVYHMPNSVGVDECCIWGDYFYLEAMMRLTRDWESYW